METCVAQMDEQMTELGERVARARLVPGHPRTRRQLSDAEIVTIVRQWMASYGRTDDETQLVSVCRAAIAMADAEHGQPRVQRDGEDIIVTPDYSVACCRHPSVIDRVCSACGTHH